MPILVARGDQDAHVTETLGPATRGATLRTPAAEPQVPSERAAASFTQRLSQRLYLEGPTAVTQDGRIGPNWRLDYVAALSSSSWLVHLCVTILATVTLVQADLGLWPYLWSAGMVVVTLSMLWIATHYLRTREQPGAAALFGRLHTGIVVVAGLFWGGGAILAASSSSNILTFYTLVLGGTALGAVSSQHAFLRSCMSAIWTSMPLLAYAYFTRGNGSGSIATGIMMLLYAGILTILSLRLERFVSQNVDLNRMLVERMEELNRTSQRLDEAHAEKSRFLAQASHDLRQPIHAIGLFIECLKGMRVGREGQEILRNIDFSLETLSRLCRSLLDLSALDVGRVRPNPAPTPVGDIIAEVVRQGSEAARQRGVTLRHVPTRLWADTDPALLHAMVQNLVSNAIKYAPGARVLVGVRRREGLFSIEVHDTGPGIAQADQKRIFKEFVQLGRPAGMPTEGLGLGLSIVSRLARLLDMRAGVRSQPGTGSVFFIADLRPCSPGAAATRTAPPRLHHERLRGLRVLVLDDAHDVRNSTAQLLVRWGCSVTASARYESDWAPDAFDFVITDYHLGETERGDQVITRLRARSGRRLPAAIVSGDATDEIADTMRKAGVSILHKPVRPAQLRSVLLAAVVAQTSPSSEAIPAAAAREGTLSARNSAET
jgi:signal transduction histidine kinase/CheY-like chemotaxis protein